MLATNPTGFRHGKIKNAPAFNTASLASAHFNNPDVAPGSSPCTPADKYTLRSPTLAAGVSNHITRYPSTRHNSFTFIPTRLANSRHRAISAA